MPWIKALISEVTGFDKLSTTMNMDECVAHGCALQAAMLSSKVVRDFAVVDHTKFPSNIIWASGTGAENVTGVVGMSVADLQIATDAETKIRAEMKEIEDTENVFSHS